EIDIDALDLIDKLNSGDFNLDTKNIFDYLIKILSKSFKDNIGFVTGIFVLVMLSSLVDNVHTSFKNEKSAHLVITGVVVLGLIKVVTDVTTFSVEMIDRLILFINSLLPTLMTLMATSGKIGTSGILNPLMIGVSSVISLVIKSYVIPVSIIGLALKLTGLVTEKNYLENFGIQLYKLLKWILGLVFTVYVGIISIIGVAAPKIDEITLKTTKYAVGSFIPYVGGMLADSVDLILVCSEVVKNSVGIAGLLGIISIAVIPCVEIAVKVILTNLMAVMVSPVAGKNVVNSVNCVSACFSVLLGMMVAVSVMYVLSVTVIIFVGGA
ncbi:MAG: stage III sporulation protein AE, partial [Clostridia bacterium]|nr:stage III sporulation protein AE [Clostridia bacterium]